MIRVLTAAGVEEFPEADAYTIGPPNPPQQQISTSPLSIAYVPFETLPGSLKLWKVDPKGDEEYSLVALFSPNGWVALDFRDDPEPPPQIADRMGFQPPRQQEVEP